MQRPSSSLKNLAREHRWFFLAVLAAGAALRLLFLVKFRALPNDSLLYGDLGKNWLQHGVFGQTTATGPEATYIRLPGYPLILGAIWLITGVEHYTAVMVVQIVVDLLTCFVIADLARRIASTRAARAAFAITALCPFFANYAATALTETWAIFLAALAIDLTVAAFDEPQQTSRWIGCGLALGGGILLRPDGGMLLAVIGGYGFFLALKKRSRKMIGGVLMIATFSLAPLIPWTIRNWRTFHVFQPLAPFSATMPWEFVPHGFHRWVRTWSADYSSVEDVWFKVDGEDVSVDDLPPRAWDSEDQKARTQQLFDRYNDNGDTMSPEIDRGFDELASERIHSRPLRYCLQLPLMRAADLWLRPRTEMLPIDPHWWRLREDDPRQFWWSVFLGALNLTYVAAAIFAMATRRVRYLPALLGFAILRTAFLAWLPNPEPRYMLECYPALIAVASAAFSKRRGEVTPVAPAR
jgi:4-amino-4-deoxy-L-arabinose transferase-like glycosyltransferase